MRLTSITITNLAAFPAFTATLPAVAIIEGSHGVGKSSLERVICYALGRRVLASTNRGIEHDPSILHGTAEEGEAVITFDDGPLESLRVIVRADSTDRKVKLRGRKAWQAAGSGIDEITSALAYDPMRFKDLTPKERLEAFLRVVPIEISTDEVKAAVGDVYPVGGSKPGLDSINQLYADIFAARRTENTAADTLAKHAAQLAAALPPASDTDWSAEVRRLQAEKEVLDKSEADEIERIRKDLQGKKDVIAGKQAEKCRGIDDEIGGEVSKIEAQIQDLRIKQATLEGQRGSRKLEAQKQFDGEFEIARVAANAEAKEIKDANAPLRESLVQNITTAEERSRGSVQAEGTRRNIAEATAEAAAHAAKSAGMTAALDRLTELKASIGGRMKIKGVTIASPREGMPVDICREESGALVPFSIWNDADADSFCLRMAVLFRGPCGIVMVDNLGNFNEERRQRVIERCKVLARDEGMQFLLGMATKGDLKITEVV